MESSVHDKESFTKEQSKFSGSKSLNIDKQNKTDKPVEIKTQVNKPVSTEINTGPYKRMTVAELFMKESEKDLQTKAKETETVQTIEKFDKMDLYKSIFLSDSENEEIAEETKSIDYKDFIEKPKNVERNTSPPRGIFANIDFDELNSWKRQSENKTTNINEKSDQKTTNTLNNEAKEINDNSKEKIDKTGEIEKIDADSILPEAVYGPKIPDNLQKRLEEIPENNFKPIFRRKDERDLDESSSSDSWVEAKVKTKKEKKKKNKKHKSKKKSKHKKKDR